jgi:replicative DNA helicase
MSARTCPQCGDELAERGMGEVCRGCGNTPDSCPCRRVPAGHARNEPPEMGPHPADQPRTDGSSALAPVVKIGNRRQPAAAPWDKPVPLGTRHTLPPFPVDALPEWVGDMVSGVAVETQTPPDIPGTIALTTLSAAAAGRIAVCVRDGWDEPANLYGAAVAEPGTRKSAVYRALTAPLYAAERVLNELVAQERYEKEAERVRLEQAEKVARDNLLKDSSPEALKAAAEAARELEEFGIPQPLQLVTGDVSPEECISILDEQGGRLAIMSAEGRVFDIITGRYSNGEPCLSPFLEGHAGDPLRVNRRGRYEYIERPALTIGVCIQPTVLQWIASKPRLRGQGLLARFLYSVPPDLVGYRASEPPAIDAGVRGTYEGTLKAMVLSLSEWDEPMVLMLTDSARKVVVEYLEMIEPRLRPDGDLYGVRDWAAKLAGAVVRLAALMHIAGHLRDGYRQPVTEVTMRQAVKLGDYYTAHALAAFGAMSSGPHLGLAGDVLGWLYPDGSREYRPAFSQRDAHRRFQERDGHATTAEEIAGAIRLLEIHGYIRSLPPPPRSPRGGRAAAPRYEVCPTGPDGTDRTPKQGTDQR